MQNVPFLIRRKCPRCEKSRDPREFVGPAATGYCLFCYENHKVALDVLSGEIPKGCVECGVTTLALSKSQPGADMRMSVVMKDGLYAVLCPECADRYELANKQMFRGTPYGDLKRI
jgi:endogenous inhibitor of DNA gyrase (YacG/DUF329 family)